MTARVPRRLQPYDTDLAAIAALATTPFGRAFLTYANEAAFKAGVNLEIGTDVQGYDSDLAAIALLTTTSFGRALLTLADNDALQDKRVGEILLWPFNAAPTYSAAALDGSTLSRSLPLWSLVENDGNLAASEGAKTDAQFGPGNGSTTFSLPDWITDQRFLRMVSAASIGHLESWAIENISGYLHQWGSRVAIQSVGGVFSRPGSPTSSVSAASGLGSYPQRVDFDASSVVNTDTETRPINVGVVPYIITG
ncbi:MAG: phage tail protein [Rhodospirillales bacterium]|nr:phage tail protein [Rhodospirillales bacterium]